MKILCDAFRIEFENSAYACERKLIEQAFSLNHAGKSLTTILDDEGVRNRRLAIQPPISAFKADRLS
ncbi:MAG: hypothetical protein C0467_31215 [Planctomycetaceae bacterium]|nr:hypothetical protein [Planctomycetaceae bacterium]